jgi:hypothetical protein
VSLFNLHLNQRKEQSQQSRQSFTAPQANSSVTNRPPVLSTPIVVASPANTTQINVSWNAVPGATSYTLQFNTSLSLTNATLIYSGTNTSYSHTGLTPGVTYYYFVVASAPRYTNSNVGMAEATTSTIDYLLINGLSDPGDMFLINRNNDIILI